MENPTNEERLLKALKIGASIALNNKNCLDADTDNDTLEYFLSVLGIGSEVSEMQVDLEDAKHMLQHLLGIEEISSEQLKIILAEIDQEFSELRVKPLLRCIEEDPDADKTLQAKPELLKADLHIPDISNEYAKMAIDNVTSPNMATNKSKKKKAKVKVQKRDRKEKRETNPSGDTEKKKNIENGVYATKRFERFHKTWAGKGTWEVQDHRKYKWSEIEDLDDDDYSSAWLECLKHGIPWGGRGAGGRGVARVTGETRDVYIQNVTCARGETELLESATLKLVYGKRYGLIGRNGTGKTTLIRRMAMGSLPGFPPWVTVQHVEQELKGTDMKPVDFVLQYDFERTRLLKEEEHILESLENDGSEIEVNEVELQQRLNEIYGRLEQIGAYDADTRAEDELKKLGFTSKLLNKTTSELSGGWRMRVALAGALFMKPDLLLLDEPTNHLDVLATRWLEHYISDHSNFAGTVVVVTHDRRFLNVVAEELIVLRHKKLTYFAGTYQEYVTVREQQLSMQTRKSDAMEKRKKELTKYIDEQHKMGRDRKSKGGDQKKLKQIRSRKKKIEKLEEVGFGRKSGHRYKTQVDYSLSGYQEHLPQAIDYDEKPSHFAFPDCSEQVGTAVQLDDVSFGYPNQEALFKHFSAQVDNRTSRIGIIGCNGAGKSTLVNLILENLIPCSGVITKSSTVKTAVFCQDMVPSLPLDISPVQYIMDKCKVLKGTSTVTDFVNCETTDQARQYLGSFGLKGKISLRLIGTLSGGQKSRVVFAAESLCKPQLYIMDEPTNHLDIESIETLSKAVQKFTGAVLLVSHDRAFLGETCTEIWVFEKGKQEIQKIIKSPNQTNDEFVDKCFEHLYKSR